MRASARSARASAPRRAFRQPRSAARRSAPSADSVCAGRCTIFRAAFSASSWQSIRPFKNHKNREAIPRRVLYSGNCEEMHMLQRLSYTQLYVLDQDAARDFYVDKLGFEVRTDARMDNGLRWLTVGPRASPSYWSSR